MLPFLGDNATVRNRFHYANNHPGSSSMQQVELVMPVEYDTGTYNAVKSLFILLGTGR